MRKIIFLGLFVFLHPLAQGQSFNFEKITVQSIEKLQQNENAQKVTYDYPIGVSQDYFPNRRNYSLAQPIIFTKKDKTFQRETSYYFSKPDSVVRLIEYQWDGTDSTTEEEFYQIIEQNKSHISKHFKKPGIETKATETKAAKSIWENESVYVQQFFIPGLVRIRVLVSWK